MEEVERSVVGGVKKFTLPSSIRLGDQSVHRAVGVLFFAEMVKPVQNGFMALNNLFTHP